MRICLVVHGFPPRELAGVETYTLGLARALAARGERVEVVALCRDPELPDRARRRQVREGFTVHWLNSLSSAANPAESLDPPGLAQAFGRWLDLEQPEVVHFQHVVKLGLGCIEEALERRLPTLYTAHDYFPVCHRIALLRPDLTRCDTLGQPEKCTRCDLGLAWLNAQAGLGDYHLGVRPEQLPQPAREGLAALLYGQPEAGPWPKAEWEASLVRRYDLDLRRAQVFGRLPRILAPTRYLARQLQAGGLDAARIRHLPYGIGTDHLAGLAAPAPRGRALVVGYVGSATKHKGVDVLLEAFALLRGESRYRGRVVLQLFGDSTDRPYVEALERRAAELGAGWNGAYDPSQLASVLARLDLVVVPSLWVENQPLVIREAFAARRPVLASRLGALPESVRDGLDGLLFEPGDAPDLARQLARLIDEPELFERLVAGIAPVKSADEQARELLAEYRELQAQTPPRQDLSWSQALPHLGPLAERAGELASLPLRDLLGETLAGLERLRGVFGLPTREAPDLLAAALGPESRAQELLRDQRSHIEHLLGSAQQQATAQASLEEELRYLRGELTGRSAEAAALQAELAAIKQEKHSERAWLDECVAGLERERDWLRGEIEPRERELVWRRGQVADFERSMAEREAALLHLEQHLGEVQAHAGAARESEAQAQALASRLSSVESEAEAARGALARAADRSAALVERLRGVLGRADLGAATQPRDPWAERIGELEAGLADLERELNWRREQMQAVAAELSGGLGSWLRRAASRRAASWSQAAGLGTPADPAATIPPAAEAPTNPHGGNP